MRGGFPAEQARQSFLRKSPVGWSRRNASPGPQDGMGPGKLMGRCACVHGRVVQHKVFEMYQFAVEPQAAGGIVEVGARDPALPDRAGA